MAISRQASWENQAVIELQHREDVPNVLIEFLETHPKLTPDDFDSPEFVAVKPILKRYLNEDQGGLCAYCESHLAADSGQIDHIKPKKGPHAYPHLAFSYTNYAHSCVNQKTCGQKKKAGILPIEPGLGCNAHFRLSTDGNILPLNALSRHEHHLVEQTIGMLGLRNAGLIRERETWIKKVLIVIQQAPSEVSVFLADKPFRYILRCLS